MSGFEIGALYRQYGPLVLRRARAILGEEQAARDAVQDVFMRALGSAETFRGESSPATWLYRVTTNLCLNVIRDRARRADLLAANHPPREPAMATSQEDRMTVAKVLERLPEDLREVAIYYFVDQMSRDEIAQVVGVSLRTVGNRLERFQLLARAAVGDLREVAR